MKKTIKISNNLLSAVTVVPNAKLKSLLKKEDKINKTVAIIEVKEREEYKKATGKSTAKFISEKSIAFKRSKKLRALRAELKKTLDALLITELEKEIVALEIYTEEERGNLPFSIMIGHEAHIRRINAGFYLRYDK